MKSITALEFAKFPTYILYFTMTNVSNVCLRTDVPYAFPSIKWRQDVGRDQVEFFFFSIFFDISQILLKMMTDRLPLQCPPPSDYPAYLFRFPPTEQLQVTVL